MDPSSKLLRRGLADVTSCQLVGLKASSTNVPSLLASRASASGPLFFSALLFLALFFCSRQVGGGRKEGKKAGRKQGGKEGREEGREEVPPCSPRKPPRSPRERIKRRAKKKKRAKNNSPPLLLQKRFTGCL